MFLLHVRLVDGLSTWQSSVNVSRCLAIGDLLVLAEDVTQSCDGAAYKMWRLLTGILPLALWVLAAPAVVFVMLLRSNRCAFVSARGLASPMHSCGLRSDV